MPSTPRDPTKPITLSPGPSVSVTHVPNDNARIRCDACRAMTTVLDRKDLIDGWTAQHLAACSKAKDVAL